MSSTTNAASTRREVTVGEIFILREEFIQLCNAEKQPAGIRLRAGIMAQLLEELVECRRTQTANI